MWQESKSANRIALQNNTLQIVMFIFSDNILIKAVIPT